MKLKFAIAFGVGLLALAMLALSRSLGLLDQADRLFYGMAAFAYLIGLIVGTWVTTEPQHKTFVAALSR